MSSVVHVANTHVEFEMAHLDSQSIEQGLSFHSSCLQLQFLPLLYALPDEIVAVTALPPEDYFSTLMQTRWFPEGLAKVNLLQEVLPFQGKTCISWGPSMQVKKWADVRKMHYAFPDWNLAKQVNSKAFSLQYSTLPEARLLDNEVELAKWVKEIKGPKVLKTCFGFSGRGNWHFDADHPSDEILAFCQKEWKQHRPMIGEPWLDRLFDFSTQWIIHPNHEIEYLGATRFETNEEGIYQGTLAGPESNLFHSMEDFLLRHREFARNALSDMADMGFFGYVGVDALLYRDPKNQSITLYPIVEINGRQTMSLAALRFQKKIFPHQIIKMSFQHANENSLPLLPFHFMNAKGKVVKFYKNIYIQPIKDTLYC